MSEISKDITLFNELVESLLREEETTPVARRIDAEKLNSQLDISLGESATVDEDLKRVLEDILETTPKTATQLFFNQLFGGRQSKAVLGDLLAVMLNNSMYTYKVAGPQVGIEKEIIRKSCELIGYSESSNGTIATGGSMCNYMALVMARDLKDPKFAAVGLSQPMTIYTSKESHYSVAKNASFAGVGKSNIRYIEADAKGRMIPEKLEAQISQDIKEGFVPMFINATAGTTVLGAFDPIDEIANISEKYKVWLHIDGAYSGSVIFSKKYNHLVKGAERANSFSYNAHKMLGTPLTCSIILVKDPIHLYNSFSNKADYLYQTDDDDFNLGKTSFQCGRRNDALKFWTLWKSIGTKGLEELIDRQFELADIARQYVTEHPDYTLYSYEESISVCFNYKNEDPERLCTALYESQKSVVGFGSFHGDTFIRLVTINPNNSEKDILNFFKILEGYVEQADKNKNSPSELLTR